MKQTTKYVALDVHQATTVAAVREESGRLIARSVMPTEASAIIRFFRGMRGSKAVTFEEGAQAQWLHDLLGPVVDRVLVCDRRGESQQGNKADQLDADLLSELLRRGALRAVYHGSPQRAALKELARTYQNLVEDSTRVMLRLKALFRARGISASGRKVYNVAKRSEWLAKLPERGVRFRAEALYAELEVLQALRPKAKSALVAEARRDPAWRVLRTIPFLGPVRVAFLLATMQTPWRFRTKRHLWAYAGLAVVTRTSAEYVIQGGRPVRRRRAPMTRGLNRNHNRVLKDVLKGAAIAAATRPGPSAGVLPGNASARNACGARTSDTDTKARSYHVTSLENRRTLRSRQADVASALASEIPEATVWSVLHAGGSKVRGLGAGGSLVGFVHPAVSPAEVLFLL
jgi:transposase